jgi:TolA-binding protein
MNAHPELERLNAIAAIAFTARDAAGRISEHVLGDLPTEHELGLLAAEQLYDATVAACTSGDLEVAKQRFRAATRQYDLALSLG